MDNYSEYANISPVKGKAFLRMLNKRVRLNGLADVDFGIMITGNRGMGKSTLAFSILQTLDLMAEYMDLIPFDKVEAYFIGPSWEEFIAYINKVEQLMKKKNPRVLYYFIFDEARLLMEKRRAMSVQNVALAQLFTIIRPLNSVYILIAPNLSDIDKDMRDPDKAHWLLHLYKRGTGVAWVDIYRYRKSTTSYIFKNWNWIVEYLKIKGRSFEELINWGIPRRLPNGKMVFFKPLKPAVRFRFDLPFEYLEFYVYDGVKWRKANFSEYKEIRKQLIPDTIETLKSTLKGEKLKVVDEESKLLAEVGATLKILERIKKLSKMEEEGWFHLLNPNLELIDTKKLYDSLYKILNKRVTRLKRIMESVLNEDEEKEKSDIEKLDEAIRKIDELLGPMDNKKYNQNDI